MTLIDKIVHYIFLLLFGPVLKLVYLGYKVEKKVTLFCIISVLVLLTHMYILNFVLTIDDWNQERWRLLVKECIANIGILRAPFLGAF